MEFFISQLQLILPTLGLDFLRPKPMLVRSELNLVANGAPESPAIQVATSNAIALVLSHASTGVQARSVDLDGELTVLKGSIGTTRENAQNTYAGLRQRLIEEGKISVQGESTIFNEDVVFPSASAAAAVLNNRNSAGPREWKLPNGLSLRDWRDSLVDDK